MNIELNGDIVGVGEGTTIWSLLEQLGLPEKGIAVAVNHTVVPKSDWHQAVSHGARIDVVTAVQGG